MANVLNDRDLVGVQTEVAQLRELHERDRGKEVPLCVNPLEIRHQFDRLVFDYAHLVEAQVNFLCLRTAADSLDGLELINA